MSIVLFADLHLESYRQFSTVLSNGLNSRLAEQIGVLLQVENTVKERKPSGCIFLGDFFDFLGESISKVVYNIGAKMLSRLSGLTEVFLISGNHDIYRGLSTVDVYKDIPHINVINSTIKFNLDGKEITAIPWEGKIPKEGELLVGHISVIGSKLSKVSNLNSRIGIEPKDTKGFRRALLGHYHIKQILGNCTYIGCAIPNSFLELNEPGRVAILNDWDLEGIELDCPKFIYIIVNSDEDMERFIKNRDSKNYYKLFIKNKKISIPEFDYKVMVEYDLDEFPYPVHVQSKENKSSDLIVDVKEFIDSYATNVDKDLAKEYIETILEEVK